MKGTTIVAALALAAMVLGLTKINVFHHLTLPVLHPTRITSHVVFNPSFGVLGFYSTDTDIRLPTVLKGEETFADIIEVLQDARYGDKITFHLYGQGGEVDSVMLLINNIRSSQATVQMIVEAPVYSGHAYLAASMPNTIMRPMTFMMFHEAATEDGDSLGAVQDKCLLATGTDRGVSNVEHCIDMLVAMRILESKMIDTTLYLTPAQKEKLHEGHDVYIQSDGTESSI